MTPYYKKQLERGIQYQDFVYEILARNGIMTVAYGSRLWQLRHGENKARIEIKFDDKFATTGNLWIETEEKSDVRRIDYMPSGIQRDCVEYLIGNYDEIFRFPTTLLRRMWQSGKFKVIENNIKTSMGFLLSRDQAERFCMQHIRCNCDAEMQAAIRSDEESAREADQLMRELMQKAGIDPNQRTLF